jgi:hypothetical protein
LPADQGPSGVWSWSAGRKEASQVLGLRGSFRRCEVQPFKVTIVRYVSPYRAGHPFRRNRSNGRINQFMSRQSRPFKIPGVADASLIDRQRRRQLCSMHAAAPLPSAMEIRANPWRLSCDRCQWPGAGPVERGLPSFRGRGCPLPPRAPARCYGATNSISLPGSRKRATVVGGTAHLMHANGPYTPGRMREFQG